MSFILRTWQRQTGPFVYISTCATSVLIITILIMNNNFGPFKFGLGTAHKFLRFDF